jgi:flagellar hook-length control protein FliK
MTAAATMPAQVPGVMPLATAAPPAQSAEGDEAGDDISALGDAKANTLTTDASDADDDIATATATALATAVSGSAKGDPMAQAATGPATQNDHDTALDALRALTAAPTMQQPPAQAAAPAHALAVSSPVGSSTFGQELGQQVAWLGGQDIKQARIRLNPEDLGPLDVKVSVTQSHVDVSFIVQHPQAVHAVQQTLSQLDSMLAQHGLTLGQAQVGQGGSGNAWGQGAPSASSSSGEAESADGGAIASVESAVVTGVGLLDTFA